jgi:hypothetical protein
MEKVIAYLSVQEVARMDAVQLLMFVYAMMVL